MAADVRRDIQFTDGSFVHPTPADIFFVFRSTWTETLETVFTGETKRTLVSDRLGGEAAGPLAGAPPLPRTPPP